VFPVVCNPKADNWKPGKKNLVYFLFPTKNSNTNPKRSQREMLDRTSTNVNPMRASENTPKSPQEILQARERTETQKWQAKLTQKKLTQMAAAGGSKN